MAGCDMMASVFLILLGATAPLRAHRTPAAALSLLPPVNFSVAAAGLAQVLLRWDRSPTQPQGAAALGFQVRVHVPEEADYETTGTESRRTFALHQGFSASVRTVPWAGSPGLLPSPWVSAALDPPPGSPGTSVLNLTCSTHTWASEDAPRQYLVSLRCSWLLGEAVPEDGQYFLYYRYGARTEACQEYGADALGRHVSCRLRRTSIRSKGLEPLAVRVNGSSARAAIRPLERLFALPAIDHVNPPGNVSATEEGRRLSVRWEKPVSAFPAHCFDYEVQIRNERTGCLQTESMKNSSLVWTMDGASWYSIRARAAVSGRCRPQGSWGAWSRPVHAGTDEQRPWPGWPLVALTAATCLVLPLLSLTCRLCRLWARLFPPVPAPKNTIKDFFMAFDYERAGSSEAGVEVMHYVHEPGFEIREETVF